MRPEDVMKALELCIASRPKCKDCPYFIGDIRCKHSKLLRDAIALLREKDAEIARLTEENERLRAEVSVKKKLLDEAERRYDETAKRFYKEGVKDIQSEIKKTLSALCKGDVTDICRMIDQIAEEMLEGE